MPLLNLPLIKGSGVSKNAKYIDNLPSNLVIIPRETGNDSSYLRSFPGVENLYQAKGFSYAAEYNEVFGHEYRIIGNKLYESGIEIATLNRPSLSNTCHSTTNQAFVDNGTLKYWDGKKVSQIQNWAEGENYVAYPDWKFIVNFPGNGGLTIPEFKTEGDFVFNAVLDCDFSKDFTLLYGSARNQNLNVTYEYFLNYVKEDNKFYEIIKLEGGEIEKNDKGLASESVALTLNSYVVSETGNNKTLIPITRIGTTFIGKIEEFTLYALSGGVKTQTYSTIKEVEQKDGVKPPLPTDRSIKSTDGAFDAKFDSSLSWVDYKEQVEPTKSPATEYDLSGVVDVDRHKERFVFVNKKSFLCTALSTGTLGNEDTDPEHRPDYEAAVYEAQSDPDENKAIRSYQGKYIAVFGRNTTEFFVLTGNPSQIYQVVNNLQCPAGIVATGAVCDFMGGYAAIGSHKDKSLQVIQITPGNFTPFSTAEIERAIAKYSEEELQGVLLESFNKEAHQFLVIHLPNETFLYDGSTQMWVTLNSGYGKNKGKYQGQHFIYNHKLGYTVVMNGIGILNDDIASQNENIQEFEAYTPFLEIVKGRGMVPLFNLSFDSIYGHTNEIQTAFLSTTTNGFSYSENELRIEYNEPNKYMKKVILGSLGAVQQNIGFKLKCMSNAPVVWSDFSLQVGYA